ncbi:xanthine dehydrogenase family protein molybdopterin-binding subunit [Actinomycetospora termitidis]|uniref:Xanthine dehydrogenase family protein molybdopterin-binding subunit n=1 Tax=Actinomycetospora termitidis TaxID=3053470 RepID=A0ABT7MI67_9PSEU|nr:xanthine dehydrogenase family protein molybdopterin-binding subunit [Actinomycetospora sp. Odt1-22]MDL5160375.1 xanthine dehydrogenase family protein molybdopterin-binding subunit [Actinomycetospora sp. Odt1-22]
MSVTTHTGGSILGHPVKRTEDQELITGAGLYTGDLPVEGSLHAVFVRSPIAHGTLGDIDVEEARSMPGVVAIYTAADLDVADRPGLPGVVPDAMARPHLAKGKVRFVGDIVAAVIGETAGQALDAAETVFPDIEPLPAVTGIEEAFAEGAPLLFDEVGSNLAAGAGTGDVEGIFDEADVVVEGKFLNQRVAGVPMEPNACVAEPGTPEGGITLWLSTQTPHGARDALAGDLGLEADQVRVVAPRVGGGFGPKATAYPEYTIAAKAALLLGRPVRWNETRSENMLSMVHGRSQVQWVELGVKRSGKIVGLRASVIGDGGAYPAVGTILPSLTQLLAQGVYDIPAIDFAWKTVVTNTTTVGAYRGAGRPEATQLLERIIDMAADEIGVDPLEMRRMNYLQPEQYPMTSLTGAEYDNADHEKALDAAIQASGYQELLAEQKRRRDAGDRVALGIGVGSYVEVTAPLGLDGEYGSAQAHPDGTFTVMAGTSAHGQGHETAFAQLASSVLGVPMEKVKVVQSDTAVVRSGAGTLGSRSLQTGGSAIHNASQELVSRAREIAAHLLEAAVEDIEHSDDGFGVRGVAGNTITWQQVATASEDGTGLEDGNGRALREDLDFKQGQSSFPFGTHISVVEVDLDTGMVKPLRHVAVDDCGKILNPMLVAGQQHGGIAQGISQALFERVTFDEDGNPTTGNLASYTIPSAADLCSYEASNTETPTHLNPIGAKGIGESGTIGSTPAVHNAVIDALSPLGVRHIDMPLTPEAVWRAIHGASASDPGTRHQAGPEYAGKSETEHVPDGTDA